MNTWKRLDICETKNSMAHTNKGKHQYLPTPAEGQNEGQRRCLILCIFTSCLISVQPAKQNRALIKWWYYNIVLLLTMLMNYFRLLVFNAFIVAIVVCFYPNLSTLCKLITSWLAAVQSSIFSWTNFKKISLLRFNIIQNSYTTCLIL